MNEIYVKTMSRDNLMYILYDMTAYQIIFILFYFIFNLFLYLI